MRANGNGRRIYALADYTVERTARAWYFGRTSRFGDLHGLKGPYSSERSVTAPCVFRTFALARPYPLSRC